MNDGPYNWCTQHSAWGSWISRLEHRAKLICFVRDGRRGEGRLLSFRQERSTWCQERRRCSSCCLRRNPTTPPPFTTPPPRLPTDMRAHTPAHTHVYACVCLCWCVCVCAPLNLLHPDCTKLPRCLDNRPQPHAEPMPLGHKATLLLWAKHFLRRKPFKEI